jgi:hypothetical protein
MRYLLVIFLALAALAAQAKVMFFSPTQLLRTAEVIAVVQVSAGPANPRDAEVLEPIKGGIARGAVLKVDAAPRSSGGLITLAVAGPCLMYLSKGADGVYYTLGRGQGMRAVAYDEAIPVAGLVGRFLGWDKLTFAERGQLIRASLYGPRPMREFALDWITRDRPTEFAQRAAVTDDVLDGLLENLDADDAAFRLRVLQVMGQLSEARPELVAHLIDALSIPDLQRRRAVLPALERLMLNGKLPAGVANMSDDGRAQDVLDWWGKVSKQAKYARFTTPRWQMRLDVAEVAWMAFLGGEEEEAILRMRMRTRPALAHAILVELINRRNTADPSLSWLSDFHTERVLHITGQTDRAGATEVARSFTALCDTALMAYDTAPDGAAFLKALTEEHRQRIGQLARARAAVAEFLPKKVG